MPCAHCQDIFPKSVPEGNQNPKFGTKIFPNSARDADSKPQHSNLGNSLACADLSASVGGNGLPFGMSRQSGIRWLDLVLSQELYVMMLVYGLMPAFFFYDEEGGSNAKATPEQLGGPQFRNGTVLIGRKLTQELLTKYRGRSPISSGDHALGSVVAHEWAHIAQFNSGMDFGRGKTPELHADFMAGWYQAGRVISGQGTINLNFMEAASELFQRGDFDFNSPDHHGLPQERVAAYSAGMQTARIGILNFQAAFNAGVDYVS